MALWTFIVFSSIFQRRLYRKAITVVVFAIAFQAQTTCICLSVNQSIYCSILTSFFFQILDHILTLSFSLLHFLLNICIHSSHTYQMIVLYFINQSPFLPLHNLWKEVTLLLPSGSTLRYYFTILELQLKQLRLTVLTSKKMSPELKNIKRKMGLTLVRFENASVNLEPFVRRHPFETSRFLLDCITKHYREVRLTCHLPSRCGKTKNHSFKFMM